MSGALLGRRVESHAQYKAERESERYRALAVEARALAIRAHAASVTAARAWLDSRGASQEQEMQLLRDLEADARAKADKP